MWYLVILLTFAVPTVNGQSTACVLLPFGNNFPGGLTGQTITFQNYICCIAREPQSLSTDIVITLVASPDALGRLDFSNINITNLLNSNLLTSGVFVASIGQVGFLCPSGVNLATGIQIIIPFQCLTDPNALFCNGPQLILGPYSIQGVIIRNGEVFALTSPSSPIFLRNQTDYHSIDTGIKHHSASMIVITTILPILFALLMIMFSTLLFLKCCCCRVFAPKNCQQDS
ncbi:uncharacterized protein [Engystomops pustulosus]|uniref:uncharacterized protein n=1 Tax=Engystomops pustulosus TaxID=76066 RepID=UPI003AFA1900